MAAAARLSPQQEALESKLQDLVREGRVSDWEAEATRFRWLAVPTSVNSSRSSWITDGFRLDCQSVPICLLVVVAVSLIGLVSSSRSLCRRLLGFFILSGAFSYAEVCTALVAGLDSYFSFRLANIAEEERWGSCVQVAAAVIGLCLLPVILIQFLQELLEWSRLRGASAICDDCDACAPPDMTPLFDLLGELCDSVIRVSPDFELLEPSPSLAKLLAFKSPEAMCAQDVRSLLASENDRHEFTATVIAVDADSCRCSGCWVNFQTADGRLQRAQIRLASVPNADGRQSYIACIRSEGLPRLHFTCQDRCWANQGIAEKLNQKLVSDADSILQSQAASDCRSASDDSEEEDWTQVCQLQRPPPYTLRISISKACGSPCFDTADHPVTSDASCPKSCDAAGEDDEVWNDLFTDPDSVAFRSWLRKSLAKSGDESACEQLGAAGVGAGGSDSCASSGSPKWPAVLTPDPLRLKSPEPSLIEGGAPRTFGPVSIAVPASSKRDDSVDLLRIPAMLQVYLCDCGQMLSLHALPLQLKS